MPSGTDGQPTANQLAKATADSKSCVATLEVAVEAAIDLAKMPTCTAGVKALNKYFEDIHTFASAAVNHLSVVGRATDDESADFYARALKGEAFAHRGNRGNHAGTRSGNCPRSTFTTSPAHSTSGSPAPKPGEYQAAATDQGRQTTRLPRLAGRMGDILRCVRGGHTPHQGPAAMEHVLH